MGSVEKYIWMRGYTQGLRFASQFHTKCGANYTPPPAFGAFGENSGLVALAVALANDEKTSKPLPFTSQT